MFLFVICCLPCYVASLKEFLIGPLEWHFLTSGNGLGLRRIFVHLLSIKCKFREFFISSSIGTQLGKKCGRAGLENYVRRYLIRTPACYLLILSSWSGLNNHNPIRVKYRRIFQTKKLKTHDFLTKQGEC